jgi:UPF0042 nucleotide-binding protein
VLQQSAAREFLDRFQSLLSFLLPRYQGEGKTYLTISIGCTGGRHRSVVITEALREFFTAQNVTMRVTHRDIEKG